MQVRKPKSFQSGFRVLSQHPWAKPLLFVMALLPFGYLVWAAVFDQLGANPAQALVRSTGDWTLRMLCVVLAVTPLRVISQTPALARFRRMLGLFVYFYVALHLLSYSGFDMAFDVGDITRDIVKRPFILVGFVSFMLLTSLALTSSNRVIKVMGSKNWQRLHALVYWVAGLAILHFFWMHAGKNDFFEVFLYAGILAALLGWRAQHYLYKNGLKAMYSKHKQL
jgi:sulfoxide reductase heme-binding subunit YedZ